MKITAKTEVIMNSLIDTPVRRHTVQVTIENQRDFSVAFLKDKSRLIRAALGSPSSKVQMEVIGSWGETRDSKDGFFSQGYWCPVENIGTCWVEVKDREGESVFVDAHGISSFLLIIDTKET